MNPNAIAPVYVDLINNGELTLDDVPAEAKVAVEELLNK